MEARAWARVKRHTELPHPSKQQPHVHPYTHTHTHTTALAAALIDRLTMEMIQAT